MQNRRLFDVAMFACHLSSTSQQLLYHCDLIDVSHGVAFEVGLFTFKWAFEYWLEAITPDLLVHHIGMTVGTAIVFCGFPSHAYLLVHMQAIHLPLALFYARRLDGAVVGSLLDNMFLAVWLFVVSARGSLIASESARMSIAGEPGRYLMCGCALTVLGLDVLWTKDTCDKRHPMAIAVIAFVAGLPLGLCSDGQSRTASIAWGASCLVCLLLASWFGILALARSPQAHAAGMRLAGRENKNEEPRPLQRWASKDKGVQYFVKEMHTHSIRHLHFC